MGRSSVLRVEIDGVSPSFDSLDYREWKGRSAVRFLLENVLQWKNCTETVEWNNKDSATTFDSPANVIDVVLALRPIKYIKDIRLIAMLYYCAVGFVSPSALQVCDMKI